MKGLTELRKIAEAATPGKWSTETHCAYEGDDDHAVYDVHSEKVQVISQLGCGCCDVGLEVTKPDAVFVTTFDPPKVLALVSRLEQAEQAVARVREVMTDWECDEDSKGLHFDLTHALDGEQS